MTGPEQDITGKPPVGGFPFVRPSVRRNYQVGVEAVIFTVVSTTIPAIASVTSVAAAFASEVKEWCVVAASSSSHTLGARCE